jgi:hypothetical protein
MKVINMNTMDDEREETSTLFDGDMDEGYNLLAKVVTKMERCVTPEEFDVTEFNNTCLKLFGNDRFRPISLEIATKLRNRELTQDEVTRLAIQMMMDTLCEKDKKLDAIHMIQQGCETGIRVKRVKVDGVPKPPNIGGTWESDTVLRLDSLEYPEFYMCVDISHDIEPKVFGRFAESWFPTASVGKPRGRWIVSKKELEVYSPGEEFVCLVKILID